MPLTSVETAAVIEKYQQQPKDTGSSGVQIALLTARINQLQEHLKVNPKDIHGRHGLLQMVSNRRRLLKYLKRQSIDSHRKLLDQLGLRG